MSRVSLEEAGGGAEGVHTGGLSILRGLGGGRPAGDRKGGEGEASRTSWGGGTREDELPPAGGPPPRWVWFEGIRVPVGWCGGFCRLRCLQNYLPGEGVGQGFPRHRQPRGQ